MGKAARRKREQRQRTELRNVRTADLRVAPGQLGPDPFMTVDGKLAYPMHPDGNGDLHMELLPLPKKVAMGTPMLANLSTIARQQSWCTKALSDSVLRRLDPTGHHLITIAWKHTTEDWKRENVRAHMQLKLRDETEPYAVMVDLPSRQFGIFLGLHQTRAARGVEGVLLPEGWNEMYEKPNWAAARSFPKVWDACAVLFKISADRQLSGDLLHSELLRQGYADHDAAEWVRIAASPRAVFGASTLNALGVAKLIVAETEWAQAIDDNRPDQATITKFAETCRLPFDTIYLDFEGPGGNKVSVPVPGLDDEAKDIMSVGHVSGAIMYREADDGPLHIIPIASPRTENASFEPAGRVVMHAADAASDVGLASVFVDGEDSGIRMTVVRPGAVDADAAPGRIELPFAEPGELVGEPQAAKQLALFVHTVAMRALRVLYMLQGGNVELVEARLHPEGRRRLKRSQKRNWPVEIGLMVAVRWKKKLYYRPPGSEQVERDQGHGYSHAFWVQGHPAYYPLGTRIADAMAETDPDSLMIDPTPDKIGVYRMVWRPPYVKGLYDPETGIERPAVEKTRKITGELPSTYADDVS